jgi:hypothetical protein
MVKTFEEYYNDPDIVDEPSALREVHAIRLMIHDETKDMSPSELTAYYRAATLHFFGDTPIRWATPPV